MRKFKINFLISVNPILYTLKELVIVFFFSKKSSQYFFNKNKIKGCENIMPSNCILYVWCRISWHNNRKTIVYIKFISASQDFEEFLTFSQNLPWNLLGEEKKKIQNHSEKSTAVLAPAKRSQSLFSWIPDILIFGFFGCGAPGLLWGWRRGRDSINIYIPCHSYLCTEQLIELSSLAA